MQVADFHALISQLTKNLRREVLRDTTRDGQFLRKKGKLIVAVIEATISEMDTFQLLRGDLGVQVSYQR